MAIVVKILLDVDWGKPLHIRWLTGFLLLLSCFTTSEGANVLLSSPAQLRPGKLHAGRRGMISNLRGGGMKGLTPWLQNDFPASCVPFESSIGQNGTVRPNPVSHFLCDVRVVVSIASTQGFDLIFFTRCRIRSRVARLQRSHPPSSRRLPRRVPLQPQKSDPRAIKLSHLHKLALSTSGPGMIFFGFLAMSGNRNQFPADPRSPR